MEKSLLKKRCCWDAPITSVQLLERCDPDVQELLLGSSEQESRLAIRVIWEHCSLLCESYMEARLQVLPVITSSQDCRLKGG